MNLMLILIHGFSIEPRLVSLIIRSQPELLSSALNKLLFKIFKLNG